MDRADNYGCASRPHDSPACRVNHTSRPNDLQKARASRVPLSDCFGREVPGTARKTEQCEYAAEKECDHIALAAHSWITFPEPIGVSHSQRRCEDNDPNEWRISNVDSSVAQPLKTIKTRACVIDFLSCISYTGTSYPDWVSY